MQEDINQRTLVLSIKAGKMTAKLLWKLLKGALKMVWKAVTPSKGNGKTKQADPEKGIKHGKQKLKNLQKQGRELTNVEITGDNIGSFGKYAKKYNIDYSLMVDKSEEPPRWYVFFKASDEKLMEAAFREYTNNVLPSKKSSVKKKLHLFKAKKAPSKAKAKTKTKTRTKTKTKTKTKTRGPVR